MWSARLHTTLTNVYRDPEKSRPTTLVELLGEDFMGGILTPKAKTAAQTSDDLHKKFQQFAFGAVLPTTH
jgi:hypothetical protein